MDLSAGGYDLLILTDATLSMGTYLTALKQSLPEIIHISAITGVFNNIGVMAYRDYCGDGLIKWSGWYGKLNETSRQGLLSFCQGLYPHAGGDWPEATKTGLARAYEQMHQQTIVILYADAPPHTPATGGKNREKEIVALGKESAFVDWAKACHTMAKRSNIFALIQSHLVNTTAPYMWLCHETEGTCFELRSITAEDISKLTISLLLAWMGVSKKGAVVSSKEVARVKTYIDTSIRPEDEKDHRVEKYWVLHDRQDSIEKTKANIQEKTCCFSDLDAFIRARDEPVCNFSSRYKSDSEYAKFVTKSLDNIIAENVMSMALNPIFGTLWRTVCNDRGNEMRNGLIEAFGLAVDRLSDRNDKARMKVWLEESYDYKSDILNVIAAVREDEKYPCIFLDPTLNFGADDDIQSFSREELLEIGRSCDYNIQRRLGKVLTRLTYVERAEDLSNHVRDIPNDSCPKLPLALAKPSYQCKFWKVILHLVVEGTMVSPRLAALLAALSLKMGIAPLRESAEMEMLAYKDNWRTLEIPETWNTSCLALLIEADTKYRLCNNYRDDENKGLIYDEDRDLWQRLIDYKMLEMNLVTTLTARIGWCPQKSRSYMGPVVFCKKCQYPRSVTIMAEEGLCGFCVRTQCTCIACSKGEERCIHANISQTEGMWVECIEVSCRAQYIVYNPDNLKILPKCFYCRHRASTKEKRSIAPLIECSKCLSRIIWPFEYRPPVLNLSNWCCPACDFGKNTVVDKETNAKSLMSENGLAWLLRNDDNKIPVPFGGGSLYKTISKAGIEEFSSKIQILPPTATTGSPLELTIRGKKIINVPDVLEQLSSWVTRRKVEKGTCSLCFVDLDKKELQLACGRSGCQQLVCQECRKGWYGINSPGNIINVAALSCPFCRRLPAAYVVKKFGIHALPGLRDAVNHSGNWIFGWCYECGSAKEFAERICTRGTLPIVNDWCCEACIEMKEMSAGGKMLAPGVKLCPGCKVATNKVYGCNHITCPVSGCATHWCWDCGFKADRDEPIYEHMEEVHGGIYGTQDTDTETYDDAYD